MTNFFVYLILINLSLNFANSQENCLKRAVGHLARWVLKETSQNKILPRTSVQNISKIMNSTLPQKQDCIVPETVNGAKWVLNGTQDETSPGSSVPDSTAIRAVCNSSFDLVYGTKDFTKCQSGNWTPYDPICLDLSQKGLRSRCSDVGCLIPIEPDNVKWVDEETGQELTTGLCIKRSVSVTGFCKKKNYNYFGNNTFPTTKCNGLGYLQTGNFYCTDQDPKGYSSKKYCIMPKPFENTKWLTLESDKEFLAGEYVKDGTLVRVSCNTNFTKALDAKIKFTFACREGIWRYHLWNGNSSFLESWDYFGSGPCSETYLEEVENNTGCLIPAHPVNGAWATWDTKEPLIPGKYAGLYRRIIVRCNKGHKNFPATDVSLCTLGGWKNINYFGECEPICESLLSTHQYKVTCTIGNKRSENCTESLDGTIAEITCKSTYQNLHIWESKSKLRVCLRGKWNNNIFPNCIPKCGLKAPNLRPLVVHGAEVSKGGYPWHVAIYIIKNENRKYYCGGSLISDRLIITAAHCVTYQSTGKPLNESLFEVAVGKQYSNYSDPRDEHSQSSTIVKMFIPDAYKGDLKNLIGDIAILVTKEPFNLHDSVLPICVNFGTDKLEQKLLTDHKKLGYVPGFGVTETGNISETLKEIALPLIRHENCSKYLPEEFIEYYSYDKFCAGLLNQSTAVCVGDSGGGLVVQNPLDNRFYLAGIVSASPLDEVGPLECNIQQYTLFTNVADYVDFISDKGSEYLQTKIKTRMNESPTERDHQNYLKLYTLGPKYDLNLSKKGRPYLALIGTKVKNENNWFCNGHLISDRFINCWTVEVGHLKFRVNSPFVRLGIDTTPNVTDFQVVETYVSPDYRAPQVYSDIALMKLHKKVEFSEFIYPALLYAHDTQNQEELDFSRRTATWSKTRGKRVDVYLSLLRGRICDSYFKGYLGTDLAEGYVHDVQFCAKQTDDDDSALDSIPQDLCDFLPGGALPFFHYDSVSETYFHTITGLITNLKDCSKVNGVLLFTNVSTFVPWIEGIVWPPNEEVLN